MKKLVVIGLLFFLLASCGSVHDIQFYHHKVKECSLVKKDSVPFFVIMAFREKYGSIKVDKWYKVGKKKYAACFNDNGATTYAYFKDNGIFEGDELTDRDYDNPDNDLDPVEQDQIDEY